MEQALGNIRRCYNQVKELMCEPVNMDIPLSDDYWVVYHFLSRLGDRLPTEAEVSDKTERIFRFRKRLLSRLDAVK